MPIYIPKGRAREYAPLALNLYTGCKHDCAYCYVPTLPQWASQSRPRRAFAANPRPRKDIIHKIKNYCRSKKGSGKRVLLSFTSDPYQPAEEKHEITRQAIQILHDNSYYVQILTKAGKLPRRDLDLFGPADAFAVTLTSLQQEESEIWERAASPPSERIKTLELFHQYNIPTWVSLEPVVNTETSLNIIRNTHYLTDLYKIGKLNHFPQIEDRIDWKAFATEAILLCETYETPYIIKHDLAAFVDLESMDLDYYTTHKTLEATHAKKYAIEQRPLF